MTSPPPRKRYSLVSLLLLLGFAAWGAFALAGWALGGQVWWLDLPNHGPQYTFAVALLAVLLGVVAGFRRIALAFGVLGCVFGLRWAWGLGVGGGDGPEAGTRVLLANVYSNNTDTQALVALIEAVQPDVIGLLEVNDRWVSELAGVREGWPVYRELPRSDNFGIALYSRVPLSRVEDRTMGSGSVPSLSVTMDDGLQVVLTHPLPPLGRRYSAERDAQLADLAELLGDVDVVVMGDFNATPWSAHFPVAGAAVAGGTWPSHLPAPLRIPIDHVVAGRGVRVEQLRVGPDIGSDHRPVVGVILRD